MKNEILAIGATFDWISPAIAVANDLARGPGHTFILPHDCGWSGYEVRDLLAKFGVETWGLMIISGDITISVPKIRAGWAQTILDRYGIPVDTPVPSTSSNDDAELGGHTLRLDAPPRGPNRRPNGTCESKLDQMGERMERFAWFRNLQRKFADDAG